MAAQERYRLYVDESGDHVYHDEASLAQPHHRYLALVGCWFAQGEAYLSFHRALEELKQRHFPHSPDEPVILHRRDIINASGPFWRLRDEDARTHFDNELCDLVASGQFTLVGVCIDKLAMVGQYITPYNPYSTALAFLLQRYCGWLDQNNRRGDVMAESRGRTEDQSFRSAYARLYEAGDPLGQRGPEFFQRALVSRKAKLKKKSENIAGLQLADLLARAVRDDIVGESSATAQAMGAFDRRLLSVVEGKYNRHFYDGRVRGYGKVLFPK